MMKVWYNDDGDVMLSIKDNDKYEEIIKYSKFISFIVTSGGIILLKPLEFILRMKLMII